MSTRQEWVLNRRALRLGLLGSGVFVLLLVVAGLVTIPAVGAPAMATWLGVSVIGVLVVLYLLHLQPSRIGISDAAIVIHWPILRKTVSLSSIDEYRFIVAPRYQEKGWDRRYYSLHLYLSSRHRVLVGGLDGLATKRLMALVPRSKARLTVYAGNRLIEEHDLETWSR